MHHANAGILAAILTLALVATGYGQTPPADAPASPPAAPSPPAAASGAAAAPVRATNKLRDDCVVPNNPQDVENEITKSNHPRGPEIYSATAILPAQGPVEIVLHEPYERNRFFFAHLVSERDDGNWLHFGRGTIAASEVPDTNPVVLRHLADKGDTLLTLRMDEALGGLWPKAKLYIYVCSRGSPAWVSALESHVSSPTYSAIAVWSAIIVIYVLSALAAHRADPNRLEWYRYLDPVYMTAGTDGKGSLAKLQILFFSLIVAGLLAYIVARTGVLSSLSDTVLLLMGIAGVGSAAAKGTDVRLNRLTPDNAAWLIQMGWLPPNGLAATNNASWHDIITTDGEFDVYRYQTCIFSLVVGLSLLASGINQLASFEIPTTLLGILGLSQVVYVGGKLVTPTSLADVDAAIKQLRELYRQYETALADADLVAAGRDPAAVTAAGGDLAAATASKRRAAEAARKAYAEMAGRVRIQFQLATGRTVAALNLPPPVAI